MASYVYTLTQKDVENLSIQTDTQADEYSIEQSYWFGSFSNLYQWFNHEYEGADGKPFQGMKRGNIIITGDKLTKPQQEYIMKNCKCDEYV